jgi:hypothetical protein
VKTQTSLPGFDSPHDAVQENATYGGQGKAVGCVSPTALLFAAESVGLRIGFFALALIDGQAGVSDLLP